MTSILHIIESWGAGVAAAVVSYVESTPELEHHLLYARRKGEFVDSGELSLFSSAEPLPTNVLFALLKIRQTNARLAPTWIHAHSSFAGAYTRLGLLLTANTATIYTPHCYAFERQDVTRKSVLLYRLIERVLAPLSTVVAACSEREGRLARLLWPKQKVVIVPNFSGALLKQPELNRAQLRSTVPTVIAVGRIGDQKDPEFFVEVIAHVRELVDVRAIWVGDGDPTLKAKLNAAGIEVSGWKSREEVWSFISSSDVYVHTAKWEGYPMSILEAQTLGIPIVARRIDAIEPVNQDLAAIGADQVGRLCARLLQDADIASQNVESWGRRHANNTRSAQRQSLLHLYEPRSRLRGETDPPSHVERRPNA